MVTMKKPLPSEYTIYAGTMNTRDVALFLLNALRLGALENVIPMMASASWMIGSGNNFWLRPKEDAEFNVVPGKFRFHWRYRLDNDAARAAVVALSQDEYLKERGLHVLDLEMDLNQ